MLPCGFGEKNNDIQEHVCWAYFILTNQLPYAFSITLINFLFDSGKVFQCFILGQIIQIIIELVKNVLLIAILIKIGLQINFIGQIFTFYTAIVKVRILKWALIQSICAASIVK